jgi:hypothetical protein
MNNTYTMAVNQEAQKNKTEATMITAGFAALMILLMFLLKWELPKFEKIVQEPGIEVELNLPPDPPEPEPLADGGGGGGNPVQAAGPAGTAPPATPVPGENQDAKETEEDDEPETTPVTKPTVVKPKATAVTNTSIAKTEPKVIETPAPPKPKAVLGKTTTGTGRGGGAADDYDRSGGRGTGSGVGNGSGTGGGNGTGNGGGNGSGTGSGSGPRVTRGDRKIVRSYSFEGDLDKATVYANVNVSPDGIGRFVSIAKGSTNSSNAYKEAIIRYLANIKFDKADHESMITVQFNFRVN